MHYFEVRKYELNDCFIGLSGLYQAINAMYKTIRDNCHGFMENGYRIKILEVVSDSIGVDNPEDIAKVEAVLNSNAQ